MFVENNDMLQPEHAGEVHLNEWPSLQYFLSGRNTP